MLFVCLIVFECMYLAFFYFCDYRKLLVIRY